MTGFALALGLEPQQMVAVIGGGGKMPLLQALAVEWAAAGGCPLLTTTTRIFALRMPGELELVAVPAAAAIEDLVQRLSGRGGPGRAVVLGRGGTRSDLLDGFDEPSIEAARSALGADLVLVKADGSRGRGLKAHKPTEPVIPARAGLVIAVAGIGAWGQPISDETVHRSELFCEQWGYAPGERIDDDAFVRPLSDPTGYRRTVSAKARYLVFLNQVDSPEREERARRIAGQLMSQGIETWWGDARSGQLESA